MQRLHQQHWCTLSSSSFVARSSWMWLSISFVIYMQTLPDAQRRRIVFIFYCHDKKYIHLVPGCCSAYVCTVCVCCCLYFTAEFMMQTGLCNNATRSFSFLSDYIAMRKEWNPTPSGSEYLPRLQHVWFSIWVWVHNVYWNVGPGLW